MFQTNTKYFLFPSSIIKDYILAQTEIISTGLFLDETVRKTHDTLLSLNASNTIVRITIILN
jgi:thiamine transporter ThiT